MIIKRIVKEKIYSSLTFIRSSLSSQTLATSVVQDEGRECFVTLKGSLPLGETWCTYKFSPQSEAIGIINLNRPSRKNAFGRVMLNQLREAIEVIGSSPVQVVVLRSRVERCFSAGADLKERAEMNAEEVGPFVDNLRSVFGMIEALSIPSIAAIDGVALGGGLELALCCDLRYAGPHAKIGLPETKLAILPAAGGSQRLSRLIGTSAAKELIFTAAILGPQEALNYRIVNGLTCQLNEPSPLNALDKAMEVAQKIAENGPLAIKQAKVAIDHGSQANLYAI